MVKYGDGNKQNTRRRNAHEFVWLVKVVIYALQESIWQESTEDPRNDDDDDDDVQWATETGVEWSQWRLHMGRWMHCTLLTSLFRFASDERKGKWRESCSHERFVCQAIVFSMLHEVHYPSRNDRSPRVKTNDKDKAIWMSVVFWI